MFNPIPCHGCGGPIECAYKKDELDHKWHYRCWLRSRRRHPEVTVPDDRAEGAPDDCGPRGPAEIEALVG